MTVSHFGIDITVEVAFQDHGFRLNDPLYGVLDSSRLHPDWAWTDISSYVKKFSTDIGRQRNLERFTAGTATLVLDDTTDRRFDPTNTAGVYYPNVLPGKPIRITAAYNSVTYPIWWGYTDAWDASYLKGGPGRGGTDVEVRCTDGFKLLAGITPSVAGPQGVGELSGARINRALNQTDWPPTQRTVDTGSVQLIASPLTDAVLDELQVTAFSEGGSVYQDAAGNIVFEDNGALSRNLRSRASQATFGDAGVEIPYYDITVAFDDELLKNDITLTTKPGKTIRRSDGTSQSTYGVRSFEISGLMNANAQDLAGLADAILALYGQPDLRFDDITIRPQRAPVSMWPQALGRKVHDRITVKRRPAGGGSPISLDCFVEGIHHDVDAAGIWETKFSLSEAKSTVFFTHPFILDDPVLGQLDSNNVLAF